MQMDIDTKKLKDCVCGDRPKHYTVGYGRTPYYINCACGKYYGGGSGLVETFIDLWNTEGRLLPKGVRKRIDEDEK